MERPPEFDPKAQCGPEMRNESGHHLEATDQELGVGRVVEPNIAGQFVDAHREQRRTNRERHDVVERTSVGLSRAVHVETRALAKQWGEERQTLNVIPVQMAEQAASLEQLLGGHLLAEVAEAGAHVEEQWLLAWRIDRDARRVAAIPLNVIALARRRTTNAMERDPHHWVILKTGTLCTDHGRPKVRAT